MFNSKFRQRYFKWLSSPKKYIVNLEVRIGQKCTFVDIPVISRWKSDAIEEAKEIVKGKIEIVAKGAKSHGKVKIFSEF